jgi:hypothetical protein
MESITPRFLTLALAALLSTSVATHAQSGQRHEDRPARREVAAYYQANVLPVVRQQRQKLEAQLSGPDRAQLTTYRSQLKDVQARGKALRQSLHPAGTPAGTRPELADAQRQQMQQLRTETRDIMQRVAQLAKQYETNIAQLAREVEPQKEKWAADIKAIVSKNATPEQQENTSHHGHRMHGDGQMRPYFRPVAFLLMEPGGPVTTGSGIGSTSFYPNPAGATSQLAFDVKKAGTVSVDLLDKNGSKLRTLVPAFQAEPGARTQQLDLHDLPAGTYFYKITTPSGSETKRFVKE